MLSEARLWASGQPSLAQSSDSGWQHFEDGFNHLHEPLRGPTSAKPHMPGANPAS